MMCSGLLDALKMDMEQETVFYASKEMATHSSILVWKIPWTEEPGRLQSMGSDWVTLFKQKEENGDLKIIAKVHIVKIE